MATFKVGQRVRVIKDRRGGPYNSPATIISLGDCWPGTDCCILIDGARSPHPTGQWSCHFWQLAPLTDPRADAFIESIKKLKAYDEPKVEPKRETVNR